jgi:hypothetical protein
MLCLGSYGLHIDSQLDSLEKVVQAKEFLKAVKVDDANVAVYLWNNQVRASGITIERQDWALDVFQRIGHRYFLQGLAQDCLKFMRTTHGSIWKKPRHTKDGQLIGLGRDRLAMAGILWHSHHTSWFEYHAGS